MAAKEKKPEEDIIFLQYMAEKGIDPSKFKEAELKAIYKDYEGERALLQSQEQNANTLLDSAMPQGRQAGNVFVASNPLETLGALGSRAAGAFQQRNVNNERKALNEQNAMGRQAYARELASAIKGQQAEQAAPATGAVASPATPSTQAQPVGQTPAPMQPAPPVPSVAAGPQTAPPMAGPAPQIFRPGPQQSGITPTTNQPAFLSAAIRGMDFNPQAQAMKDKAKRDAEEKERKRKEELMRTVGGYEGSFGGF